MSARIRIDGRVLCAASHPEEEGDAYLDDLVHHVLIRDGLLVTEPMESAHGRRGHEAHGQWKRARVSCLRGI